MNRDYPNQAIEALCKSRTRNPIFVHYVRASCPGYHNRGHRKAISRAHVEWMLYQAYNIDPYETPWMKPFPNAVTLWKKYAQNVTMKPASVLGALDAG